MMIPKARRPITPGQVLREDFIEPLELTQGKLADALDVDRSTINEILNERRSITPEMALRLGHALGTSPGYWMNLQLAVSLYDAEHSPAKAEVERLPILVSLVVQGA
jgi:addiction module HigA family antidote